MKAGSIRFGALLLLVVLILTGCASEKAQVVLQQVVAAIGEDTGLLLDLAAFYAVQKDFGSAEDALKQAVHVEPQNPDLYIALGRFYAGTGETDRAEEAFLKAVQTAHDSMPSRVLLADLYYRERDFAAAEKESLETLTASPSSIKALLILGNSYLHRGNYEKSRKCFESITRLAPDSPTGYAEIGKLNMAEKKPDAAVEYLQKALDRNAFQMEALADLVLVYSLKGNLAAAFKACDNHLARVADNPRAAAVIYDLKKTLYLKQKKVSKPRPNSKKRS